jgi:hypothetical protein
MTAYPSTIQNKLLSAIGTVIGILLVSFGLLSVLSGSLLGFILTLLPGTLLLYMLLYVSPWEIRVDEEGIEIRTILRRTHFKYAEIRDVSRHHSTPTFNLISGGKGIYYYSVKIKKRPMSLFMFGSGIQGSDELYEYLDGITGGGFRG